MDNKTLKRSIKIHGLDKELDLEGAAVITVSDPNKSFIYIERMKSGKYKLFVTNDITNDITQIKSLEIIR